MMSLADVCHVHPLRPSGHPGGQADTIILLFQKRKLRRDITHPCCHLVSGTLGPTQTLWLQLTCGPSLCGTAQAQPQSCAPQPQRVSLTDPCCCHILRSLKLLLSPTSRVHPHSCRGLPEPSGASPDPHFQLPAIRRPLQLRQPLPSPLRSLLSSPKAKAVHGRKRKVSRPAAGFHGPGLKSLGSEHK